MRSGVLDCVEEISTPLGRQVDDGVGQEANG